MKRLLSVGLFMLAMTGLAFGQGGFTNLTALNAPPAQYPQIDATNFVNTAPFNIALPVGEFEFGQFDFSDVLTFTNRSTMSCNTGFIFDTAPAVSGNRRAAAVFGNSNRGVIAVGSATNFISENLGLNLSLIFPYVGFIGFQADFDLPELDIYATNIVNTGVLDVGLAGVMNVQGNHLDLSKGSMHVEGFDEVASDNEFSAGLSNLIGTNIIIGAFNANSLGIFNLAQGIGSQTNVLSLGNFTLPFPFSPFSLVTNLNGQAFGDLSVLPPNATPFVFVTQINGSNTGIQVVFINTNLPGISTDVRFNGAGFGAMSTPVIQWSAGVTNQNGIQTGVNNLYLSDAFGANQTNFLVTNSFTVSGVPVVSPFNYSFFRSFPDYTNLPGPNQPFDTQTLFANMGRPTNAYSAYEVNVTPSTFALDGTSEVVSLTNLPGRISIIATNWLDLTAAKITGPNYLSIVASNHFVGSSNATIVAPVMDLNLGSTNGLLSISNLVVPSIRQLTGPIDMWSGRWTNTFMLGTNGPFTNTFHIWIVDSGLAPAAPATILNFAARSTNSVTHQMGDVFISDVLNITNSFQIQARSLTVTTNDVSSPNLVGEINLLNELETFSGSLPFLQSLTNFGLIDSFTYGDFTSATPSLSFVNHGLIATEGVAITANYFENSSPGSGLLQFGEIFFTNGATGAVIDGDFSSIDIRSGTAVLTNDTIETSGDESFAANDFTAIGHTFSVAGALTLNISNSVTDGGAATNNFWLINDGINLLTKPTTGSLLGTTVTLTAPPALEVDNTWAGLDQGAVNSGFVDNAALGHLILDGGDGISKFFFGGLDDTTNYALYVDLLELRNGATNRSTAGGAQNFTAFDLAPNFKIYYGGATLDGNDISEKLAQGNNHQLVWVPSFAGFFGGTNLVIDGQTNFVNRALLESTDIDSDGDGIANASDPTPFLMPESVNLSISMVSTAANPSMRVAALSWFGLAKSTNQLYFSTNMTSWTKVFSTNQGSLSGPITVMRTNSAGFYRVRVSPPQP